MVRTYGAPPHIGPMVEAHPVVSAPREEKGGGDDQVDGQEQLGSGKAPLGEQDLTEPGERFTHHGGSMGHEDYFEARGLHREYCFGSPHETMKAVLPEVFMPRALTALASLAAVVGPRTLL